MLYFSFVVNLEVWTVNRVPAIKEKLTRIRVYDKRNGGCGGGGLLPVVVADWGGGGGGMRLVNRGS